MSHSDYRADVKDVMDDVLLPIPGVKGGKAFGYPAYKVNGKIFCFVAHRVITLKLPAKRVQSLIAERPDAFPFEANGIWREWVAIKHDEADDFRQHEDLFHESLAFVAGG